MITSKQRSYLKALGNRLDPVVHIGKEGVTPNVLQQIRDVLEARELIKVKLLDTSLLDAKETANEVCEKVRAEYVQSIGNKFIIYKESRENKQIELP
ncbi:MAG: ribosome assembly RNA-binding protein YhbY [Peptostreptococcales bacterium]